MPLGHNKTPIVPLTGGTKPVLAMTAFRVHSKSSTLVTKLVNKLVEQDNIVEVSITITGISFDKIYIYIKYIDKMQKSHNCQSGVHSNQHT